MTHADAPAPPARSTLVVTAHAGGFVRRAGGAVAPMRSAAERRSTVPSVSGARPADPVAVRCARPPRPTVQ